MKRLVISLLLALSAVFGFSLHPALAASGSGSGYQYFTGADGYQYVVYINYSYTYDSTHVYYAGGSCQARPVSYGWVSSTAIHSSGNGYYLTIWCVTSAGGSVFTGPTESAYPGGSHTAPTRAP